MIMMLIWMSMMSDDNNDDNNNKGYNLETVTNFKYLGAIVTEVLA